MKVYGCHGKIISGTLVHTTEIKYVLPKLKFSISEPSITDMEWKSDATSQLSNAVMSVNLISVVILGYIV